MSYDSETKKLINRLFFSGEEVTKAAIREVAAVEKELNEEGSYFDYDTDSDSVRRTDNAQFACGRLLHHLKKAKPEYSDFIEKQY